VIPPHGSRPASATRRPRRAPITIHRQPVAPATSQRKSTSPVAAMRGLIARLEDHGHWLIAENRRLLDQLDLAEWQIESLRENGAEAEKGGTKHV